MTNIFDKMAAESEPKITSNEIAREQGSGQSLQGESENSLERTSPDIKVAVQELLRHGYLEESNRSELFRRVILHETAINRALEPLDLVLRIDTHRGVAFLAVVSNQQRTDVELPNDSEDEGWTHPLVRKQRLTLEQSLLIAILRQAFVLHEQEAGVGHSDARLAVDEVLPNFLTYIGESGSETRDENRLLQILDQLKSHGIVSEVDKKNEFTIRPLIAYVASPESLAALLQVLKEKRQQNIDTSGID